MKPLPARPTLESMTAAREKRYLITFFVMLPLVLCAAFGYFLSYKTLTDFSLARREALAEVSAMVLTEKFEGLKNLAQSLASRQRFSALVEAGDWAGASKILETVPDQFPDINRIFLTDRDGTEKMAIPELSGAIGKNFAFRDWYQGVSKEWKPYISQIYRRAAEPSIDVISVAAPIRGPSGSASGILVLQISLDSFYRWSESLEVGSGGYVYFVDSGGRLAGHPDFRGNGSEQNATYLKPVREALAGKSGVMVYEGMVRGVMKVAGFSPVPGYRWGAIATQPVSRAFAARDRYMMFVGLVYLIFLAMAAFFIRAFLKSEKKLLDRETELSRLQAEREQLELFAFIVSHDLQEPLQRIVAFSKLLEDEKAGNLTDTGKDYLARMDRAARQMALMMEDLRRYSRVREPQEWVEIELASVVDQAIEVLRPEIERSGARIETGKLPRVRGDRFQLTLLLQNLLANALKFRHKDRLLAVKIEGRTSGGSCEIVVRDNGIGFDDRYSEQIFEPFKRLHSRTEYEGSGIGLAICRKIAILHGGTLLAQGAEGDGSQFVLRLPSPRG